MSGRQIFSESEKMCLQELIIKYKLNSVSTIAAGNPSVKKVAWARLVKEYNSIESNCKRTEAQLKKCWDNLKTRKKALLAQEKRERMRTGGGAFHPKPGSSKEDPMLIEDALLEQTDVELQNVIDSDNLPTVMPEETPQLQTATFKDNVPLPPREEFVIEPGPLSQIYTTVESDPEPEPETNRDARGRSGSRHSHYSVSGQQTPGTAKNIRARVINEEFQLRKSNYERVREREEELHRLMVEEKQWLVKAAEEKYKKAVIERETAQEILCCNQAQRQAAELLLKK